MRSASPLGALQFTGIHFESMQTEPRRKMGGNGKRFLELITDF